MKNAPNFVYQLVFLFSCTFFNMTSLDAQDFSKHSVTAGLGYGFNETLQEIGSGMIFNLGYQKTLLESERLRFAPSFLTGSFNKPFGITDTRDQFYHFTSIRAIASYDIIKIKSFSMFTGAGIFVNLSKGVLGSGGDWGSTPQNEYESFSNFYGGGVVQIGFKIDNPKESIVYEIRPINAQFGTQGYYMAYIDLSIIFKIRSCQNTLD
jgi:hypothetical protein